jgi:hypothetical protein
MAEIKFSPPGPAGVFVPPTMPAKTATTELKITPAMKAEASTFWKNSSKATGLKVGWTADDYRNGTATNAKEGSGGGGSNPLALLSTAVGFVTNPVATITSLLTGKNT